MQTRLEHANLIVKNVDSMVEFIQTALPDFQVRHTGHNAAGDRWLHLGNEDFYIALSEATEASAEQWRPYTGKAGLNHLGFSVDDAGTLQQRMRDRGYKESTLENDHPHRMRVYFHDPEGNDWEFVQYLSEHASERNDYSL